MDSSSRRKNRVAFQPSLESLDDRVVLSTFGYRAALLQRLQAAQVQRTAPVNNEQARLDQFYRQIDHFNQAYINQQIKLNQQFTQGVNRLRDDAYRRLVRSDFQTIDHVEQNFQQRLNQLQRSFERSADSFDRYFFSRVERWGRTLPQDRVDDAENSLNLQQTVFNNQGAYDYFTTNYRAFSGGSRNFYRGAFDSVNNFARNNFSNIRTGNFERNTFRQDYNNSFNNEVYTNNSQSFMQNYNNYRGVWDRGLQDYGFSNPNPVPGTYPGFGSSFTRSNGGSGNGGFNNGGFGGRPGFATAIRF